MDSPYNLSEAHFVALPSQSNIYGLSVLRMVDDVCKVLVASLRKPIVCVEYICNKTLDVPVPASKEVHFTYIPSGAEIISIDSFNKSLSNNDFIVGITFSKEKAGEAPPVQYFNIYTDCDIKSEFSLESIAQSCSSLELNFIPYQLYHTELCKGQGREIVWLLSGSDHCVHLYREDKTHTYIEHSVGDYFPEFRDLPSIVLSMDVVYFEDHCKRISAVGCEDGFIRAALIDANNNKILSTWEAKHDSPISSVKIFNLSNNIEVPSFLQTGLSECGESHDDSSDSGAIETPEFHLLVATTIEVSVVYWNILNEGFSNQKILPNSDEYDCIQCACIADIDMDGINEIILGTYSQQLLVYKHAKKQPEARLTSSPGTDGQCGGSHFSFNPAREFPLVWQKNFAYPLLAIDYLDVTGDGMRELIVLSIKGLHILQHNLEDTSTLLTKRLEQLVRNLNKNDAFKELQAEEMAMD